MDASTVLLPTRLAAANQRRCRPDSTLRSWLLSGPRAKAELYRTPSLDELTRRLSRSRHPVVVLPARFAVGVRRCSTFAYAISSTGSITCRRLPVSLAAFGVEGVGRPRKPPQPVVQNRNQPEFRLLTPLEALPSTKGGILHVTSPPDERRRNALRKGLSANL